MQTLLFAPHKSVKILDLQVEGMSVLWEEDIRGGSAWSHVLKRGTTLRITDVNGGANAGVVLLNFEIPSERYNMPDTLKAQHTAHLTKGFVLYSDMGRYFVLSRTTLVAGTIRYAGI